MGPPKMNFSSTARNQNKSADITDDTKRERSSFGKFTREDGGRNRDRNGLLTPRDSESRDEEGWTAVKPRRSFGHEEGERWQRNGDRDREHDRTRNPFQRGEQDADARRNGTGRNRFEKSWIRDGDQGNDRDMDNRGVGRTGGWRDRERRDDREWARGGRFDSRAEDVPEWMDEPAKEEKEEADPAKKAEDFERWKAMQRAKKFVDDKPDVVDTPVSAQTDSPLDAKLMSTTTPDGGRMFGMWGEMKKHEADENAAKKAAAKAKASKFAGFFGSQKVEEVPEPPSAISPPAGIPGVNEEDKEGFNRILQMLGQSNITSPALMGGRGAQPPPPPQARKPMDLQSPEPEQRDMRRPHEFLEDGMFFDRPTQHQPPPQAKQQRLQPQPDQFTSPAQEHGPFHHDRPRNTSRNGAPKGDEGPFGVADASKIDPNQAFLLNLMNSHPSTAQRPGTMSPSSGLDNGFVFPENKALKQPIPQQRRPPPGFFDDPAIAEQHQRMSRDMDMPELARKTSQRTGGPLGLNMFDDPAIAGLQRRNTAGQNGMPPQQQQQQAHMMGIPGPPPRQHMPPEDLFLKGPPPGMQRPGPGLQDGPAGLPPGMRLPPGFGPPPPGAAHNMPPGMQQRQGPGPGMQPMFPPGHGQSQGPMGMPPPGPPHGHGPPGAFFPGPGPGPNGPPMGPPPHFDPRMGGGPMSLPPGLVMQGMPQGGGRGGMMSMSPEEVMREYAMQEQRQRGGAGGRGGFGM